ncbi:molybdopterin molybdotransferase MoeA [Frigoriflavimonas asaccharolytica]|uniref:Molybdopterin molybdenumtransferase n=1 Tax=Frigoriflavimonas asaccharolytica TaxID=2735899 RepID=A0A8J8K776_9FLAO|nr:gephyrin-like molybdotransferase Glp [Frigoriflavimonas asaccharolytica]NRS91216.1 molybdopterin molybdotransferase [Frigoriflavimonas asaccharolytica]
MISVKDAVSIVNSNIPPSKETELPLLEALNFCLAKDVISEINMPPFRQSAMDGFALNIHESLVYYLIGEIKAGDSHKIELKSGEAIKIFTGAAVPDSANAVMQIEKTVLTNEILELKEPILLETNIRPLGEQIKKNEIALSKNNILNAAAIGFLAGLGITKVSVYKKPSVGILVTGNELVKPRNDLEYGKIYESNSIMLQAALLDSGFKNINTYNVDDDFLNTKNSIEKALTENDIILISGGISVGDYDFVEAALAELKVETLFYKVNQKPGKPLLAGKIEDKLIFALPGNPAASLTCYYIYVKPILNQISGISNKENAVLQKQLSHDFAVNNTRSQFLKANFIDNEISVLSHQASSMLNTFALSNCLIHLPEGNYELKKGSKVSIYLI